MSPPLNKEQYIGFITMPHQWSALLTRTLKTYRHGQLSSLQKNHWCHYSVHLLYLRDSYLASTMAQSLICSSILQHGMPMPNFIYILKKTLNFFKVGTTFLGKSVCKFQWTTCAYYHTTELPQECAAQGHQIQWGAKPLQCLTPNQGMKCPAINCGNFTFLWWEQIKYKPLAINLSPGSCDFAYILQRYIYFKTLILL